MNSLRFPWFGRAWLLLLFVLATQANADITVRVSVKFILKPDGTRPSPGTIGTSAGFDGEVTRGNGILAATGRGYSVQVVEYVDIQPPVPAGEASEFWFNLDARSNRQRIENAALANQTTWRWSGNAVNIYVNNSSSGQCSFPGAGGAISLGNDIGTGTVLHELGHYFGLRHTHSGDPSCDTGPFNVADGDGLSETIPDHNCLDRDGLSRANFGGRNFNQLNAGEQAQVNSSWLNVMSYHLEDTLLEDQMDFWTDNADGPRRGVVSGRTWFVAPGTCIFPAGNSSCNPFAGPFGSVIEGVNSANPSGGDIVLLRPGSYTQPGFFNKPLTLRATRAGSATIR